MSQKHDTGCTCDSNDKTSVTIQYIDGGILSKAPFCSDCISFYKSCANFKIINKTPLKNLGYMGIQPKTSFEASNLINKLKNNAENSEKYCSCVSPIPNSITNGKTCQTCKKLLEKKS